MLKPKKIFSSTFQATVSSKGQIVIPKEVREALGFYTGTEVMVRTREDGIVEIVPVKKNLSDLFKMFPKKYEKNRKSDDELIMQAILEENK
ncbi:MAG: AbrB/MazE/SpoVT family DNA-binding domain-containing protein [Bdellovibrionota bacterium]